MIRLQRYRTLWLMAAFLLLPVASVCANTVGNLAQVKKIYVPPTSTSAELHDALVKQLRKIARFEVVRDPKQADAVLEATGQLWIKGYIAVNPKGPRGNREPVYSGFLSAELKTRDNQVLWSYLVTPTKFHLNSVSADLAASLVKGLAAAQTRDIQPIAPSASNPPQATALYGAGATFPAPLYRKWFESYQALHANVSVRYDPVGSESGMRLLSEAKVDFAGSDVPPDASTPQLPPDTLAIASVLGGVVPIYNLKDLAQDLKFTPQMLAGIYLGKITKWNDPLIQSSNRGVSLPNVPIVVVHRSDGSGTTHAWSDYLSHTSAAWKTTVGTGTTLAWPVGSGAEGNEGVADMVQQIPHAIGYVELVYAIQHELSFGYVLNAAGEFVHADLESLSEAARTSVNSPLGFPGSIINAPGKRAYPIASFTWLLVPKKPGDPAKQAVLSDLIRWILTDGQRECSALAYSPLPRDLAERELRLMSRAPEADAAQMSSGFSAK